MSLDSFSSERGCFVVFAAPSTALLRRSVATEPGRHMHTATPCGESSMRRELKKPFTACFVAAYRDRLGKYDQLEE